MGRELVVGGGGRLKRVEALLIMGVLVSLPLSAAWCLQICSEQAQTWNFSLLSPEISPANIVQQIKFKVELRVFQSPPPLYLPPSKQLCPQTSSYKKKISISWFFTQHHPLGFSCLFYAIVKNRVRVEGKKKKTLLWIAEKKLVSLLGVGQMFNWLLYIRWNEIQRLTYEAAVLISLSVGYWNNPRSRGTVHN